VSVDELYQEIILDHYRAPRNKRPAGAGGVRVHHDNPLCGDELDLRLELADGRVKEVSFDGHGCAISQASASMMTEAVAGKSVEEALALIEVMRQMMHGARPVTSEALGDLAALEGVQRFPVRVKCALLGWMALRDALTRSRAQAVPAPGASAQGGGA